MCQFLVFQLGFIPHLVLSTHFDVVDVDSFDRLSSPLFADYFPALFDWL